ncbi:MAG: potassium-transporting ATPase subunit F [Bosea sp.]|nr:potassium-transporting ATPase subunit F [Bosea sp. (in: a-proteobacteria)]
MALGRPLYARQVFTRPLCPSLPFPLERLPCPPPHLRSETQAGDRYGRHLFLRAWDRSLRAFRPLCGAAAQGLTTMALTLLYAAAAIGLAVYMVAALLRPDRF